MLYRIGYIEQMVTGIIRMRQAAKEANVAAPIFAVSEFFKVTFLRSDAPSLAASDGSAMELNDRQRTIVAYLEKHQRVTAPEASALLGLSKVHVRSLLQKMAAEGNIEKIGNNRYTYYVLPQRDAPAE